MKMSTSPTPSQTYYMRNTSSPLPIPVSNRTCSSATTKSYKYLRRLFKFDQMDFEFALWQMLYLFISPQKVYQNSKYRKRNFIPFPCPLLESDSQYLLLETKLQFARDDPAFLVLLVLCLCGMYKLTVIITTIYFNFIIIYSDVRGLCMDVKSKCWPKYLLSVLRGDCGLSVVRCDRGQHIMAIHQQILTRQPNRRRYRMGLFVRRAFECIFSSTHFIAFRSIVFL